MSLEENTGPEYLETQADRLAGQNHIAEADQARRLAQAWSADRVSIDELQTENSELQRKNDDLQRRLDNTLRAVKGEASPA